LTYKPARATDKLRSDLVEVGPYKVEKQLEKMLKKIEERPMDFV